MARNIHPSTILGTPWRTRARPSVAALTLLLGTSLLSAPARADCCLDCQTTTDDCDEQITVCECNCSPPLGSYPVTIFINGTHSTKCKVEPENGFGCPGGTTQIGTESEYCAQGCANATWTMTPTCSCDIIGGSECSQFEWGPPPALYAICVEYSICLS